MSDKPESRFAAIAARGRRGPEAAGAAPAEGPRPRPGAPRVKPVRTTLDLPPATHADFSRWVIDAQVETGRNIDKRAVLLILLDELLTDSDLAAKVTGRLRSAG